MPDFKLVIQIIQNILIVLFFGLYSKGKLST